jgi:hypothetical protein
MAKKIGRIEKQIRAGNIVLYKEKLYVVAKVQDGEAALAPVRDNFIFVPVEGLDGVVSFKMNSGSWWYEY